MSHRKHTTRRSLRRRLRPFTTMAIVIGLVAGAEMSAAIATEFLASEERELTDLLNEERVAAGLPPLPTADALRTVSRRHSVAMMLEGRIFHASNLLGEVEAEFPDWAKIGENVGRGPNIPITHQAFMDSPTHRANILDPAWQTLGIGVVPGGGQLWMTQRFLKLLSGTPIPVDVLAQELIPEPIAPQQASGIGPATTRLAGADRLATGRALVESGFDAGAADGAVLADAFSFHGALAGAALAGALDGPVVLSSRDSLSSDASAALVHALGRDSGKVVHLVGSFDVAVVNAIRALGLNTAVRGGPTVAAWSAAAARALPDAPDAVIVTRDDQFPDALAAAAVSAKTGWPILFTSPTTLAPETRDVIAELGVDTIHVVGGTAAVSQAVADQLAALGPAIQRHAGADRIDTALRIADLGRANGLDGSTILLATARAFPDALAGGALAPQIGGPVVLTEPDALSPQVRTWLQARPEIEAVTILGGTGAVKPQVQFDLGNL